MKIENIDIELTEEFKQKFIQELTVDEIFDLINWNTGDHYDSYRKSDIIERVLNDFDLDLVSYNKVADILENLPSEDECKTVLEAYAVQELNKLL